MRIRHIFLSLSFFTLANSCLSQTLVLKNGQTVIGKDIHCKKGSVLVTVDSRETIFPIEEVVGFFEREGPLMYLKFIPDADPLRPMYNFFERVVDGKIRIYKEIAKGMGKNGNAIQFFAEKGDSYGCVLTFYQGKQYLELLKTMVKDRPEFLDRVEDSKFKYTPEGIVNLLTEYNLEEFEAPTHEGATTSIALFYLIRRAKAFPLKITVDDKTSYDMPPRQGLSLSLPSNEISKVCASYEGLKSCILVRRIPHFNQYFKVDCDGKQIKLDVSDKGDALYYINRANDYR